MKLDARRVDAFLKDPGAVRVVLLHGDDVGLIRDRASRLVRAVIGAADDPFRLVELERDRFASIPDEASSLPMTGGRRVVRIREAVESVAPFVQAVLSGPATGLLILEGAAITAKGKLRGMVEKSADAASIACYPLAGKALEQAIVATLGNLQVTADAESLEWLTTQLGADQAVTLAEVEKLAVYARVGGRVDLTAARTCVGDLAGLSLDDALFAATSGDVQGTDRALELAMAEGAAPVGVLRAALMHLQRLQRAKATMATGRSAAEAAKSARPPVFFRREQAFISALMNWPEQALEQACQRVWETELACKRTGSPAETLCRNALVGLSQRGAAAARRR